MAVESPVSSVVVRFAAFEVDLATGELRKHGIRIKLQDQPFQILSMLLERPGALVTREQIQQRLWPADTFVDFDHSVNTAIRRLRDALGDDADTPRFIETLPRRGYRLLAEVTTDVRERPAKATTVLPTIHERRRLWPASAVVIVVVAALLTWRLWPRPAIDSVAVLPFANEANDSDLDYLADGIPGRVIDKLSEIPSLRVASRNSAFTYRGASVKTHDVASTLHVRAVVFGAIRREGSMLHISAELVDTKSDRHLWGGDYTVSGTQITTIDGNIAREVARKLHQRVSPEIRSRVDQTSANSVAYEAYLRGNYLLENWLNANARRALSYFQTAIDADPNFALAYVGMEKAYSVLAYSGGMSAANALALAEASADHALLLDPNMAEAHVAKGSVLLNYRRNTTAAEREFQRALQLNPNLVSAYRGYCGVLETKGRLEEAAAAAKRTEELDPLWDGYSAIRVYIYVEMRRFDDALRIRHDRPALKTNYRLYAQVYAAAGRREEALAELGHMKFDQSTSPLAFCTGAKVLGMTGNIAQGRELLRAGMRRQEELGTAVTQACTPYDAAMAYAALGDRSNMLAALDAAERNSDLKIQWVTVDLSFDPYRSDPAFKEVVRRATTPR